MAFSVKWQQCIKQSSFKIQILISKFAKKREILVKLTLETLTGNLC